MPKHKDDSKHFANGIGEEDPAFMSRKARAAKGLTLERNNNRDKSFDKIVRKLIKGDEKEALVAEDFSTDKGTFLARLRVLVALHHLWKPYITSDRSFWNDETGLLRKFLNSLHNLTTLSWSDSANHPARLLLLYYTHIAQNKKGIRKARKLLRSLNLLGESSSKASSTTTTTTTATGAASTSTTSKVSSKPTVDKGKGKGKGKARAAESDSDNDSDDRDNDHEMSDEDNDDSDGESGDELEEEEEEEDDDDDEHEDDSSEGERAVVERGERKVTKAASGGERGARKQQSESGSGTTSGKKALLGMSTEEMAKSQLSNEEILRIFVAKREQRLRAEGGGKVQLKRAREEVAKEDDDESGPPAKKVRRHDSAGSSSSWDAKARGPIASATRKLREERELNNEAKKNKANKGGGGAR